LKSKNPFATETPAAHSGRKHSKFSASGAERWFNCPGSVQLSEGLPDTSSVYAEEGTRAHELLEAYLRCELSGNDGADVEIASQIARKESMQMVPYVADASDFIAGRWRARPGSDLLVETRIILDWIHPEMFGTYDAAVVEQFGMLEVFDFKYGQGHIVSPTNNLQLLFYAIGLAHKYDWNFERVRMTIVQPRAKGYSEPVFWELPIKHVKSHANRFKEAVERVESHPTELKEGSHCHWCKAKKICPLKADKKELEARTIFGV
jgi:hypothetical protein